MEPDLKNKHMELMERMKELSICKGDFLFLGCGFLQALEVDLPVLSEEAIKGILDALIEMVGSKGTIAVPIYDFEWCEELPAKTDVSTMWRTVVSAYPGFEKTGHPIYTLAVWGREKDAISILQNKSAFGENSPYGFMEGKNVKLLSARGRLGADYAFVYYVEEKLRDKVPYRYRRNFRAYCVGKDGKRNRQTYSVFVPSQWFEVCEKPDALENRLIAEGAAVAADGDKYPDAGYTMIALERLIAIVEQDILKNKCRNICTYKGQDEEIARKHRMYGLLQELFPICRSLTGEGVRTSLQILQSYVPELQIHEEPSGTQVYDWTIPPEWNIFQAYIENERGERIVDFKSNNLHILGYSVPMDAWLSLEELKQHIYVEEDQPEVIPYVTSYYKERWGFCMSKNQLDSLEEGSYHVVIESELKKDGFLTYGEAYYPGSSDKEILISTYLCHPSMANNECSGPTVAAFLARYIAAMKDRKYGYRFVFIPETIGSITWLSKNFERLSLKERVIAGFVLTCVGDERNYSFLATKYGDTLTDRLLRNVLKYHYPEYVEYSFLERGSDERQYNSPGIELPVCDVCRSRYTTYPEYHTSADDLSLVTPDGLHGTYEVMIKCVRALEHNAYYRVKVLCEPQLGKRGLYPTVAQKGHYDAVKILTNFITYCDGRNDLIGISEWTHVDTDTLIEIKDKLLAHDLIEIVEK